MSVLLIFPEVLPWALWCYGQHPVLWHPLGLISSETGVQQRDPLGPLLFSLVLHRVVSAIASNCPELLLHMWYLDDGAIAGPKLAVLHALSIVQDLGPPNGLFVNTSKCELYSIGDLSIFPPEMKSSKDLNFEILGAPIGDFVFCAKYASQKRAKAQGLLHMLEDVGSVDPQVALLLLCQCGSSVRWYILLVLHLPLLWLMHCKCLMTFTMLLLNALQWMPLATPGNRPNSLLAEVGWVYVASHTTQQQPTFHL